MAAWRSVPISFQAALDDIPQLPLKGFLVPLKLDPHQDFPFFFGRCGVCARSLAAISLTLGGVLGLLSSLEASCADFLPVAMSVPLVR